VHLRRRQAHADADLWGLGERQRLLGKLRLRHAGAPQSGIDPMLALGVVVDAQYWYRDPADPWTSGLSNALEFTIAP
jgi:hypothetical protein